MNSPLVSIVILTYNNYKYIHECINSCLSQTYSNIELVISNDGSKDFNSPELDEYLRMNKTPNINNFVINNNETNIGTVKNVNKAVKMSSGKYYLLIAGDDAIYSEDVVQKYVDFYEEHSEECLAVGKALMMDEKLDKVLFYYPEEKDEPFLYSCTTKELLNELCKRYFFSTSTLAPRAYLDKYGYYDENYTLIEDVPFYVKALNRGTPVKYLGFPMLKHRDGGISHGNTRYSSESTRLYLLDTMKALTEMTDITFLNDDAKTRIRTELVAIKLKYFKDFTVRNKSKIGKAIAVLNSKDKELILTVMRIFLNKAKAKIISKFSFFYKLRINLQEIANFSLKKLSGLAFLCFVMYPLDWDILFGFSLSTMREVLAYSGVSILGVIVILYMYRKILSLLK
ncbi:glycosyltransferase [Paenibacillus qinlingensis]|uniref:glycosyltransferase n=1 Tax=Paenibacillus qinlingensis TaxID=1837343 RepID=UPI001565A2DC|nr:glycosyltransferase [Paenibacillus qinlingensis]NQX60241.1 glycosyltransferase [Paenibacillus qinlingensis]